MYAILVRIHAQCEHTISCDVNKNVVHQAKQNRQPNRPNNNIVLHFTVKMRKVVFDLVAHFMPKRKK